MATEDAVGGTAGKSDDVAGEILKRLGWNESADGWHDAAVQRDADGNLITTGSWHCGRYPQDGMRLARVVNGDEDMLADTFQMLLDRVERFEDREDQLYYAENEAQATAIALDEAESHLRDYTERVTAYLDEIRDLRGMVARAHAEKLGRPCACVVCEKARA